MKVENTKNDRSLEVILPNPMSAGKNDAAVKEASMHMFSERYLICTNRPTAPAPHAHTAQVMLM